jgi:inhibitor of cysteine peptidase
MNHTKVIASLGIICLIAVAFAGCVGTTPKNQGVQTLQPTPVGTAIPVNHLVVTEEQNTATVYVNLSTIITVKLQENPTTGFMWNLTTTPGLQIINDTYVPSDTTGKLVGSGGTHIWDISTVAIGEQKIQAVYKRSWEPTSGNETNFSMTVKIA